MDERYHFVNVPHYDKLQKLQNRAARVLLDASYDSNSESLREILQLKDVRHQLLFDRAVTVFTH